MSDLPREFMTGLIDRLPWIASQLHVACIALTESPIEATFATAFLMHTRVSGYPTDICVNDDDARATVEAGTIVIQPQAKIDRFRVDFVLWKPARRRSAKSVVVECDGYEFHHSTKELIEKDKRRDEELNALGYDVARFSGQRIHRDAFGCAAAALDKLLDTAERSA